MLVMYAFARVLKRAAQSIAPAKPKVAPLYIQRKLTPESAAAFIEHFKAQGFSKVLAPEELHVTIVYSKEPVEWEALEPDDTELVVPPGTRKVMPLGDKGAVVMSFKSERLEARHRAWELSGASWDYDSYTPHLTITYRNPPEDLKAVKPFPGELEFGPEIMEPINESYAADVVEKREFLGVLKSEKLRSSFARVLKENPYHDASGKFSTKDNDADGVVKPKNHTGLKHVKGLGWTKDGQGVDAELAGRMKALRVPPAWTDVWVSGDPGASLQATGIDSKGRKQYLYSKEHSEKAAAEKFARLQEFQGQAKKIREAIQKELRERGDDSVAVLRMIERTGIRIGSDAETGGKVKAYGATTLLGKHVTLSGGQVKLNFTGKHGHENTRDFYDKDLAEYIRKKGLGPEDRVFSTNDARVRDRMKVIADPKFSPKDFRTWHGTAQALKALQELPEPKNDKEREAQRKTVAKRVAEYLNNTPAVALESYIDPAVFNRPRGVVQKSDSPEDLDSLMDDYVETTQYDQPGNAAEAPEPEDD